MPRRYRRYSNRRRNKYGRYAKYAGQAIYPLYKPFAGQVALHLAKKAISMMNVEYKHHDVQISVTSVSQTPTITQLTNIGQGDTSSTRDGDSIKITAIHLKGIVALHTSAATSQYRVMLILDKQTNGAIYNASDVLEDTTAVDNLISPLNLDNKYRFRVLMDKLITLSNGGGNESVTWQRHIKLNQHIRFGGTAGTIADLNTYSLSLMVMSNEPTNVPNHSIYSRIRYVDN